MLLVGVQRLHHAQHRLEVTAEVVRGELARQLVLPGGGDEHLTQPQPGHLLQHFPGVGL